MADALPPHARPNLSIEERASRVEFAVAGCAECADKARRIIVEALVAAVADGLADRGEAAEHRRKVRAVDAEP